MGLSPVSPLPLSFPSLPLSSPQEAFFSLSLWRAFLSSLGDLRRKREEKERGKGGKGGRLGRKEKREGKEREGFWGGVFHKKGVSYYHMCLLLPRREEEKREEETNQRGKRVGKLRKRGGVFFWLGNF